MGECRRRYPSWLWGVMVGLIALVMLSAAPTLAATQYKYDAQGRLIAVIYDNGERIDYHYDAAGNRTSVVTSSATNVPPVAMDDTITVNENVANYPFDPRTNDTDANGGTLTVVGNTNGGKGTVSRTTTQLTYSRTPGVREPNEDAFVYSVADASGAYDTGVVRVIFNNLNPDAMNDSISVGTQELWSFDPRENDTDPGNDPLTLSAVSDPPHGFANFDAVGGFVIYYSDPGYVGSDSFTYTIIDGDGGTDTATVNVTVSTVNHPPVAADDVISVAVNGAKTFDPRANDTDADSNPLTITGKTNGAHGSVTFTSTSVTYTPTAAYSGPDAFTYTVSDGAGGTDTATVVVSVVANTAPDAVNDSVTLIMNAPSTFNPLANDTDAESQALTVVSLSTPGHGSAAISGGGATITYTPTAGYSGADSFTYTINDTVGAADTATVSVTVSGANSPPVAVDDDLEAYGAFGDIASGSVNVLDNDSDPNGQTITIISVTNGTKGTTGFAGGVISYSTNTGNAIGIDHFTYTISDGAGGTDTAEVTVSISRE